MCVVDRIYRLKLYRTQIEIKFIQISETDEFPSFLLSGKCSIYSGCVHCEWAVYSDCIGLGTEQTERECVSFT